MNDLTVADDSVLIDITLSSGGETATEAYGELVRRYERLVLKIVFSLCANTGDAEDLAQETFIDGYLQLRGLSDKTAFRAWICTIARRKCARSLSRRRSCDDIDGYEEAVSDDRSPYDYVAREEQRKRTKSAFADLSQPLRKTAELFYLQRLSVAEISTVLSAPEGTVKRRLHSARQKLKKELNDMNENLPELINSVKKELTKLRNYYALNNDSISGFETAYNETVKAINGLPDSAEKSEMLSSAYEYAVRSGKGDGELKEKADRAAEKAGNYSYFTDRAVDELFTLNENYAAWLEKCDELTAKYPQPEAAHLRGVMLFWKGRAELDLKRYEEAERDFSEAVRLTEKSESYHANAIAALRAIRLIRDNAESFSGCLVMGESFMYDGTKLRFIDEPGFSVASVCYGKHRYNAIFYYVSRCGGVFFDMVLRPGECIKTESSVLSYVYDKETVAVPAGIYECRHYRYEENGGYAADVWYAEGVGLVKTVIGDSVGDECYELAECEIKGGKGLLPFCEGNRWLYVKQDIPDFLYQSFERRIEYTDGITACFSVTDIVTYKKGMSAESSADSEVLIERACDIAEKWQLDSAVEALGKAISANTTDRAARSALYMKKYAEYLADCCKKKYRFCPSSVNTDSIYAKDGKVIYNPNGEYCLSPYRFGTRFEENRIFGVKILRYAQEVCGCVWDDRWVPGYKEVRKGDEDADINIEVVAAGRVSVKAGSFDNCLKLSLTAEIPGKPDGYYFDNYNWVWCGKKEFFFAPGVGIILFNCTWGKCLDSSCELLSYSNPAGGNAYMPLSLGCEWIYGEKHLEAEGYDAKRCMSIISGRDNKFTLGDSQLFVYRGAEDEYEAFKKTL